MASRNNARHSAISTISDEKNKGIIRIAMVKMSVSIQIAN